VHASELVAPQVSAGESHTVGLESDSTVVAVGNNDHGECEVGGRLLANPSHLFSIIEEPNDEIDDLNGQIDDLNNRIDERDETINDLDDQIGDLENQIRKL
jgi:alpha-tubulin suppressor-like RCC1 family protein